MATNAKRSLKIHTAIRTNFASKYKSIFTAEIEDCALADLPDEQETITFDGGEFGSFSKQQWLEMVHLSLAEIDSFNERPWFMKICSASIALSMRIEKPKKS